ncbi:GNAT family N-acetyltransferase [Ideonella sp. DXS29W]|uniref:GNAT family N-acetyltransferase n=1 Tax=Ideonella lacteola TaxID=2984193 RepID=A0ABU9C1W9_9BURK
MVSLPCLLESLRASDVLPVTRLFSEPIVRAFLGGPLSPQLAEQRAAELISHLGQAWAVRPAPGSPVLLGVVLLDRHHDLEDLEVSYLFLPEHWGRGYARAAVKQALAYAFGTIGLPRVVAETQSANGASVRLLEHLGFCLVGNVNRFGAEQSIYRAQPSPLQAAT